MLRPALALTFLLTAATAHAQWQLQDAHTTADLRGIDNVGGGVAWASGSNGTILRTEDAGFVWQLCAKPPGGEHLDFRAIQAFDNNTAIIMSIGKGDQSRLYKTTDGCQTWKLVTTNRYPDGFWDAIKFTYEGHGFILGDPVTEPRGSAFPILVTQPHFFLSETLDGGKTWTGWLVLPGPISPGPFSAPAGAGVFAASNSSILVNTGGEEDGTTETVMFGTGGPAPSLVSAAVNQSAGMVCNCNPMPAPAGLRGIHATSDPLPIAAGKAAGVFSIAQGDAAIVAVGGDYTKPDVSSGTAACSPDNGKTWTAATTPPHGFRSAVAYDSKSGTWITVGPNGTDISTDDGRNWRPLHPDPKFNEPPEADRHWNALSLPFVVGPHGRIATLRPSALEQPQ